MKISRALCAALAASITGLSQNIAVANDYAFDDHNDRLEHSIYLKIPFAPSNVKKSNRAINFGYSFNFKRTLSTTDGFPLRQQDIKASLIDIRFSSTRNHKLSLAGQSIAGINHAGLYLGPDGGASTEEIFIGLGIIAGLAAIVAFSGQDQTPDETQ